MARKGRPPSASKGARQAVELLLTVRAERGWSESELARAAGVSQSAAHRALNAARPRWTPTLRALSSYAENAPTPVGVGNDLQPAIAALAELWNGSHADVNRLVRLLTLVAEFRRAAGRGRLAH